MPKWYLAHDIQHRLAEWRQATHAIGRWSLEKSYEHKDLSYRVSYGKLGLAFFMSFDISHERTYVPNTTPIPEDEE